MGVPFNPSVAKAQVAALRRPTKVVKAYDPEADIQMNSPAMMLPEVSEDPAKHAALQRGLDAQAAQYWATHTDPRTAPVVPEDPAKHAAVQKSLDDQAAQYWATHPQMMTQR